MSLTPLPPPLMKVHLWHIFFALPTMNGPSPCWPEPLLIELLI